MDRSLSQFSATPCRSQGNAPFGTCRNILNVRVCNCDRIGVSLESPSYDFDFADFHPQAFKGAEFVQSEQNRAVPKHLSASAAHRLIE